MPKRPEFKYCPSGHEIAETILQTFLLKATILDQLEDKLGPIGHFRVKHKNKKYVLHVKRSFNPTHTETVGMIVNYLNKKNLPVLSLIRCLDGKWSSTRNGLTGTLVQFVDGRHATPTIEDVVLIAKAIGSLHLELSKLAVPELVARCSKISIDALEQTRQSILLDFRGEGIPLQFHKKLQLSARYYDPFFSGFGHPQMLHGDLSNGNILFPKNRQPVLIDFEDLVFSLRPAAFDYGMAALRFALSGGLGPDQSNPIERVRRFKESYEAASGNCVHDLTEAMKNVARNMIISLYGIFLSTSTFHQREWDKASILIELAEQANEI